MSKLTLDKGERNGENIVPQNIAELRKLLGDVVFLPCNQGNGGKGPILKEFQKLTPADMTQAHIDLCECLENRIGVLLGAHSGGQCTLDCDCQDFAKQMLHLNPWLARTLTTTCNRGRTYWIRISGNWAGNAFLFWRGAEVGEWKADGVQSVVAGQDTETKNLRRFVTRARVVSIDWSVLIWPDGMEFGGKKSRRPWPPAKLEVPDLWQESIRNASNPPRSSIPSSEKSRDVEHEDVERIVRSTSLLRVRSTSRHEEKVSEAEQKRQRIYRQLVSHLRAQRGNRNALLNQSGPFLIHAVCEQLAVDFLMRHYDEIGKPAGWEATRKEHLRSVKT